MSLVEAPPAFRPGPKEAVAWLASESARPRGLARPAGEAERLAALLEALDLAPDSEAVFVLPPGPAPWPFQDVEREVAAVVRQASVTEVVEAVAHDALRQAAWLHGLAARLAVPLTGLRLSLAVHRSQPCRKFHRDTLPFRIVTTYVGCGTEWVLDEELLGVEEVPVGTAVHRCPPLTPFVFAGKLAPAPIGPGVVHRSPPSDGGSPRLVLRVDLIPAPTV